MANSLQTRKSKQKCGGKLQMLIKSVFKQIQIQKKFAMDIVTIVPEVQSQKE